MTGPAYFDDRAIVRQVIDLQEEMRHGPIASRLGSIEFGAIDVWSAFRYEIADLLYDYVWEQAAASSSNPQEARRPLQSESVGRIRASLWHGLWGLELFSTALEKTGALDLVEAVQFVCRSRSRESDSPATIALAGFAHRPGLVNFSPFARQPETEGNVAFQILLHDDNLSRHRRSLRAVNQSLIACESFLQLSDYKKATRRARDVQAILAPEETRATRFSDVLRQFKTRAVHRRRVRRLSLGAEAVRRFMESSSARTFVIPDERQPLARAAAFTAKRYSKGRVVVVSEPVDQLVRKMPYWDAVVSDVVVVSNAGVTRALTRSGISDQKFRICRYPGVRELLDTVAASNLGEAGTTPRPTVLYCDQGLPGSSDRFTELVECLGNPPRAGLMFRPHPVQSTLLLSMVVTGAAIDRTASIVEAIHSSDVVVTYSSMVATIAALMERPVVLWNPAPSPTMPALLLQKAAYWARTRDELAKLITECVASRPDHPLRKHQRELRNELASSCWESELEAVL